MGRRYMSLLGMFGFDYGFMDAIAASERLTAWRNWSTYHATKHKNKRKGRK
jgi:hypothetical protein